MTDHNMNMNEETTATDNTIGEEGVQEQHSGNYLSQLKEKVNSLSNQILIWGIVSLAVADMGGCLAFIGSILSLKVNKLISEYDQYNMPLNAKAKVGRILSKIAFFLGIALTAIVALCLIIYIVYIVFLILIYGASAYSIVNEVISY